MESSLQTQAETSTLMRLSASIGMLSISAACLVGIGKGSFSLPMLVIFCVVASWIYTDWLGWIRLNRYVAYAAMIGGAGWSIWDYLGPGAHQQHLYAVAILLIYAQLPLFFQKKEKRTFEQIGIFVILEFVVASLVNDNVFFGILLIPALGIGCWSLVLFALHTTQENAVFAPIEKKSFWDDFNKIFRPGRVVPKKSFLKVESRPTSVLGLIRVEAIGMPMALAVLLLAAAYFYVLPRLSEGSYSSGSSGNASVGFSEEVSLDQVGKMLQNDQPVMRLELLYPEDGRLFRPLEPPYIRGVALASYSFRSMRGIWYQGNYSNEQRMRTPIPTRQEARSSFVESSDLIIARITEQSNVGIHPMAIPPFYRHGDDGDFQFDRDTWQIAERNREGTTTTRRKYDLLVQAFDKGAQTPFLPESVDVFEEGPNESPAPFPYQDLNVKQYAILTDIERARLITTMGVVERVLQEKTEEGASKVDQAIALESYLANSTEYEYTLDLTLPRDNFLDPVEDFIRTQKKGNCQIFAASLAMMLRSLHIPARVVVGFRPNEYNAVGNYFLVRQLHAHAWVEAYFPRKEFENSSLKLPPQYNNGAWLRLDPTPAGNGSNAGGSLKPPDQQTLDFAQQLWKDYVMNVDRSSRSESFEAFGMASGSIFQNYLIQIRAWALRMQQGQFIAGFLSPDRWLSWQGAITILFSIGGGLLLWRFGGLLNPFRWKPRWNARRSKMAATRVKQESFRRCIRALERIGLKRSPSQTHSEFSDAVQEKVLPVAGLDEQSFPLKSITRKYCLWRYGTSAEVDDLREMEIESRKIETAVEGMLRQKLTFSLD